MVLPETGPAGLLAALIDDAAHGFVVLDDRGSILDANRTFRSWIGAGPDGWRGGGLGEVLTPASSIYFETHLMPQTMITGRIDEVAIDIGAAGTRTPVLASTRLHRAEDGSILISLSLLRIEQRRRYERELLAERRRAEDMLARLREAQARLLATSRAATLNVAAASLAHELNQPLMAGTAYLALARRLTGGHAPDPGLLPAMDDAARSIMDAGEVVRRLRRVTRPQRRPDGPSDANAIIDAAWQIVGADPAIDLVRIEVAASVPRVSCAIDQMGYALAELVMNALEATEGRPDRTVHLRATAAPGDMLRITIDDNGPGLDTPDMFALGRSTKPGHFGLGLANARTIVEAQQGSIGLEPSRLGGCSVYLQLPSISRAVAA